MMRKLWQVVVYLMIFCVGFVAGLYTLPILTAPPSPSKLELATHAQQALYSGEFKADLAGSDALHYGNGQVRLTSAMISFDGTLSPGPDYQLYLANRFIDNEADFLAYKGTMTRVASINTFDGFIIKVPADINIARFNTVIVWCESFEQFITAAQYQ
ncbi:MULTISPECIES: DM13 domain-containing protein [unclassified Pseudoalteromonas]|uniref:DM13 domain-containing protein n=1 Tax=unclassified Pseudoalteromonas TaxID=194690 RepID=UPI001601EC50|nr:MULTISPECIES: DM13 domain-containing protein [unclassified Pseudoalteromonas]MBB1331866.1 DM13 domain-containing protein [Pseudoalteromonas sp. SR41-6]MBB1458297.1 DM13 domain-containing protein [Pseudoalteromonas sp. SG41-8]MBB1469394.1 DM13 domain-containing protein [Pseudoalteromonas sp. SG41-5]